MAMQSTDVFAYRTIEIYKEDCLGFGSYGAVYKAKCDGLLCAAKVMHLILFDQQDPGRHSYLRKFNEECHLLSLVRHPNVVQYLATWCDPETHLPVLLMELCDENLTKYLEHTAGSLSYHIQVNICHEIALALVYLHSNGLIHRDLTGNNVLMIAGPRAKITDFGMSKHTSFNTRMTPLTHCPGNRLYMSPETLDEDTLYTTQLDIFSFGVIIIQILTGKFPSPTERFKRIGNNVRRVVPETERRQAHLTLIPDTHSLKPIALECLKNDRPSALHLSDSLSNLKQSRQYTETLHQAQCTSGIQKLQLQLQGQRILTEDKARKAEEFKKQITEFEELMYENERKLQASKKLESDFEQSLHQKDDTIAELQHTISAYERKIEELKWQDRAHGHQSHNQPPHTTMTATKRDISKMRWKKGKSAPDAMARGAAVVYRNTAYFRPHDSNEVYSYKDNLGKIEWSKLSCNPYKDFSLAVIDGLLTSVGGFENGSINTLLSLGEEGEKKRWIEVFPSMPTPRSNAACVTTENALIVAGGDRGHFRSVDNVEVMNKSTKQWSEFCPLPQKCWSLSACVFEKNLYLAGGLNSHFCPLKSVFTCSLASILPSTPCRSGPPADRGSRTSTTLGSRVQKAFSRKPRQAFSEHNRTLPRPYPRGSVWKEITSLPMIESTMVSFGCELLAIGGYDDSDNPCCDVYRYDSCTNSWIVTSQMKNNRSFCLAVTLPENTLIVVGGYINWKYKTDSVEILA